MPKKLIRLGIVMVGLLIAGGWFAHKPLLMWYYMRGLDDGIEESDVNYDGIAGLGQAAVPTLLDSLRRDDAHYDRVAKAIGMILDRLAADGAQLTQIAQRLADSFPQFSASGKWAVLQLAESLPARGAGCKEAATKIVQAGLQDDEASNQEQAISLAVKPEFGLGAAVVPLLKDSKPEVRRSALLAVAALRESVPDDDLLPCLHDSDAEIRGLCETALKARGLRDKDVQLGRLIIDPKPLKRLEVLRFLPHDSQLDPHAWLNRLCQDPSPAVRASAARAAMDPTSSLDVDLSQRVRQMAQSDPDGTVRQIADYLIRNRERVGSPEH